LQACKLTVLIYTLYLKVKTYNLLHRSIFLMKFIFFLEERLIELRFYVPPDTK